MLRSIENTRKGGRAWSWELGACRHDTWNFAEFGSERCTHNVKRCGSIGTRPILGDFEFKVPFNKFFFHKILFHRTH
jgi:hypothetical protein